MILIAETVSLGILSLPSVVASLGLVPGVVMIILLGMLTWYSGYVMGDFRKEYPWVQSFGDALEVIGNSVGHGALFQEVFGWAQTIFQVFVMGSHLLTWTICLNTLTNSSTCTVVWAVVGLAVFAVLSLPRTMKFASYMSIASFLSIFTAVMMTMVDVGIERPIGSTSIAVARQVPFTSGFMAVTNIAIAFCGHSCYFGVMAEFKHPEDWPKALAMLQLCDTMLYLVSAIVIYVYVGPDVPSPALNSAASMVVRKAIWGVAIPTIVIAGVIYGHIAAKYVFARIFKGSKHAVLRTKLSTTVWWAVTAAVWALALVIAESIPVFNALLSLICALFASWFSYGLPGVFWLFVHRGHWFDGWRRTCGFCANVFLFVVGTLLCVLGLWCSAAAISADDVGRSWTCKSNASS